MINNWPTEEYDLSIAKRLINKYVDLYDGQTIELYEVVNDDKLEFISSNPEWVAELTDVFKSLYGSEIGDVISKRVITKCVMNGATSH